MIKPEQIPEEVRTAFLNEYNDIPLSYGEAKDWDLHCIAAAINAWPGVERIIRSEDEKVYSIILNTQEKNDD